MEEGLREGRGGEEHGVGQWKGHVAMVLHDDDFVRMEVGSLNKVEVVLPWRMC